MLHQNLIQGQHLKILPQQLQMLQLFHLNTLELDQRIQNELEENPLIEELKEPDDENLQESAPDEPDYRDWDEYAYDDNYYSQSRPSGHEILLTKFCVEDFKTGHAANFRAEALEQLYMSDLTSEELHIGEFIIQNLTDEGFLDETIDDIVDEYMLKYTRLVCLEDVQKVLDLVRNFEPVGLAASSIRECLLAQLKKTKKQRWEVKPAIEILTRYYDYLKARNFDKLRTELGIKSELEKILAFLGKLKLKPVASDNNEQAKLYTIVPDFVVTHRDGHLEVSLYREKASTIKINSFLKNEIYNSKPGKKNKATSRALAKRLNAAEWFVNAVRERECVMLRVMKVIANLQYEYFTTGDDLLLNPMILKDVAEKVEVDISTVSRITSNKYVQMPFGCILLKELFNEGIANKTGEMVNVRKVQEVIKKVIRFEDENNPFTDAQIATFLSEKGLRISRRTVTKYRNEIQIPSVKMRLNAASS